MTQEYEIEEWKKWSSVYCSKCYKWLANYKGWLTPIPIPLYCRKCSEVEQQEQKTKDRNCLS